jgi:hypothetical protein
MKKKLAIITIHGMGETLPDYSNELETILRQYLGSDVWNEIHLESIYYQGILQNNERRLWNDMQHIPPRKLRWVDLRKFMLFGFADATSLEHENEHDNSVYKQTQKIIVDSLRKTIINLENQNSPLILIAQSLGGQVISNYIYDSQEGQEIWKEGTIDYLNPGNEEKDFLKLKTLRCLCTTGCNIPLFVGGFDKIKPFDKSKMHSEFQWKNYYDRDDVLGWPLKPLSDEYSQLVEDIEIDSGDLSSSWNPLSHNHYWADSDFTKPLMQEIRNLISKEM